jgi:hypothetical protein
VAISPMVAQQLLTVLMATVTANSSPWERILTCSRYSTATTEGGWESEIVPQVMVYAQAPPTTMTNDHCSPTIPPTSPCRLRSASYHQGL